MDCPELIAYEGDATDDHLLQMTTGCPRLTHLTVRDPVADWALEYFLEHRGYQLQTLSLSVCGDFRAQAHVIATHCPVLHTLRLSMRAGFTKQELKTIVAGCGGSLRTLAVLFADLTDGSLEIISAGCPHLVQLELGTCTDVTREGVCIVASRCMQLEQIAIYCCDAMDDETVMTLATQCLHLRSLHHIVTRVTSEGAQRAVQYRIDHELPSLRVINNVR